MPRENGDAGELDEITDLDLLLRREREKEKKRKEKEPQASTEEVPSCSDYYR